MIKTKKKILSQINSQKRKKDFLKWIFWCSSNAITLKLRYHGTDLDNVDDVVDLIAKRWITNIKDKK